MAVVIVGMAPNRVIPENCELWGMLWDDEWHRFDRLFDPHEPELYPLYLDTDRIEDACVPVYLHNSMPIMDMIAITGDYYQCTPAYMLGMAIMEGVEDIIITGVTAREDRSIQRANLEYLIGFARGRGINVEVIGDSDLLTFTPIEHYTQRYGYVN